MNEALKRLVQRIAAPDEEAKRLAAAHLDQLTKPPGSLGKLESLVIRVAGIIGQPKPDLTRKAVVVMAADHGVCEEGVSAYPAEVTPQMLLNMLEGGAAVNVFARQAGAEVICVDMGVNADLSHPALLNRKLRKGTANMAKGPAMTCEEAEQAILAGAAVAEEACARGIHLFVTGELGIGNTTASAAVASALTGLEPSLLTGRGTGVDNEGLSRKTAAVQQALAVNQPDREDAVDVLAKVGGLEIAGMVGLILGAAARRCPVILDGFISGAAALTASRLCPASLDYMLASHVSDEKGHALLLEVLGLEPMLRLDMRLGEGTGGVLALPLIDSACAMMREMATFASAGVSDGTGVPGA
jgi:nicotinate-nucleotide--dimethylbenzimidazole phosphoribosyltransferase